MRRMRQTASCVLLLLCLVLGAFTASAADDRLGTVVDGSLLTDNTEATSIAYPKERGKYLSYGSGGVTIAGTRRVTLSGATAAYQDVDQIQVTMFLQRLVGDNWEPVETLGPAIKYNDHYVYTSNTYSVTGGYYYRAFGQHYVSEAGTTEYVPSYSDGVWVN